MKTKIVVRFSMYLILFLIIFTSGCANQDIAGKATLTSEQTQFYWSCMKVDGCIDLLKSKQYQPYKSCALLCKSKAEQYTSQQAWCKDSDNDLDYFTKGRVTTDINLQGKGDYCYTFNKNTPSEKTYLMEGRCVNNKYQYVQKNCGEVGKSYSCEEGVCVNKGKLDNTVDTLIIVNSDEYGLTDSEIKNVFQMAEDYWLIPQTQIKFNILDIKYYSLSQKEWKEWVADYYFDESEIFPEYIVVFQKENVNGGYQEIFELEYWLNFLNYGKEINYCNEFKSYLKDYNGKVIPAAIVNYGHKYAVCGYDSNNEQIISDTAINGQCLGQEGLPCIWKNGYQMCSDKINNFYAKDMLIFTAHTIVHELLHSYADDDITYEHFTPVCAYSKLGWDNQYSFDYYLDTIETIQPFDDITQEYAGICPYVWQQFISSQQICPK